MKNTPKDKTLILIVSTVVLVILAIAFLSSISEQTLLNTQKTSVSDESFNLTSNGCYTAAGQVNTSDADCNLTVAYAPTGWKATDEDCYLSSVVLTNNTGTVLVLNTDYTINSVTGEIAMKNTTSTTKTALGGGGIVKVDYAYCGDNYLAGSWGRSMLNTTIGLFAIAILLAVIYLVSLLLGKDKED